jgi:hypothetical protein
MERAITVDAEALSEGSTRPIIKDHRIGLGMLRRMIIDAYRSPAAIRLSTSMMGSSREKPIAWRVTIEAKDPSFLAIAGEARNANIRMN